MCGIVGFNGHKNAAPVLLDGLSKLEYRGYDSSGIAVRDGEAPVRVVKAKGRLSVLCEKLWYRTYKMGNTWGAIRDKCTSTLQ